MRILATLAAAVVALAGCGSVVPGAAAATAEQTRYGLLASACDAGRAGAQKAAGIGTVTVELNWSAFEPDRDRFDAGYAQQMHRRIATCRAAGLDVVLGLGLQYPPAWARALPAGRYLDQYRNPSAQGEVNTVFSAAVRDAVAGYLRRVAADIGFDGVTGARLGTSHTGELGFPGPVDGNDEGSHDFWAFDDAAQTGTGLAAGASRSPMPGWVPGMTSWNGRPVGAAETTRWYEWYTGALVGSLSWQADTLVGLGFRGEFHLPVPGRGVLPTDREQALAHQLDGRDDPDGNLERGQDYPHQFALVAAFGERLTAAEPAHRVVVDFTGIDDVSAVRARASGQDSCRPDDTTGLQDRPGVEAWSAQRWTIANARAAGLPVVGENPGSPDLVHTGGASDSDDLEAQMTHSMEYADACGLGLFLWAFEEQLYDPSSGVALDDYARHISARS